MAASPESSSGGSGQFQLKRILLVVVPVVALLLLAFLFFGVLDGPGMLAGFGKPPLVAASGRVVFNGAPLSNAQITSQPLDSKLRGAIGWTDEQGSFTLQTDIQGKYVDGAFAGQHKLAIAQYGQAGAASAPPLLTPEKYASFGTSDLTIVVSKSPDQNKFELKLEPEEAKDAGGTTGQRGGGGGGGRGRGGRGGPPPDPEEQVNRTFDEFDTDKDGKLTRDEVAGMAAPRRSQIQQADANGDEIVDREELKAAIEAAASSGPAGRAAAPPNAGAPANTDGSENKGE